MRLQFNKIGYEMYDKEQSRRVPAVRAKPGNPGYGFRRARWRDTCVAGEDRKICETIFKSLGVNVERIDRIKKRVHDFKVEWDAVRRPSRPAGPGRPRGHKRGTGDFESRDAVPALVVPVQQPAASTSKKSKKMPVVKAKAAYEASINVHDSSSIQAHLINPGQYSGNAPMVAMVEQWESSPDDTNETRQGNYGQYSMYHQHHNGMQPGQQGQPGLSEGDMTVLLGDENQSLRSLNMSLIYEREQLLSQLSHTEQEVTELHTDLETLLSHTPDGSSKSAFSCMARRISTKGGPAEIDEASRKLLQQAFDCFETSARRRDYCPTSPSHDSELFAEINDAPQSCDDLREFLRTHSGGDSCAIKEEVRNPQVAAAEQQHNQNKLHQQNQQHHQQEQQDAGKASDRSSVAIKSELGICDDGFGDFGSYEYLFSSLHGSIHCESC